MNDKIIETKREIRRIINDTKLKRVEKYNLVKNKASQLNELEYKILFKEYIRDYKTFDRLKEIKDIISMFLTGIGLIFTICGSFFIETLSFEMVGGLLGMVTIYIFCAIILLWLIQVRRTSSMNKIQFILDILES